jgi:hypothetical protein
LITAEAHFLCEAGRLSSLKGGVLRMLSSSHIIKRSAEPESFQSIKRTKALACIIHQRWKGSRTVVGIEDERQEAKQIWG